MKCGDGMSEFGTSLKEAMGVLRLSVNTLSAKSGISRQSIYRVINGEGDARLSTARKLTANVLHDLEIERQERQAELDRLMKATDKLRKSFDVFGGFGHDA